MGVVTGTSYIYYQEKKLKKITKPDDKIVSGNADIIVSLFSQFSLGSNNHGIE